jgi:hypothetical protein
VVIHDDSYDVYENGDQIVKNKTISIDGHSVTYEGKNGTTRTATVEELSSEKVVLLFEDENGMMSQGLYYDKKAAIAAVKGQCTHKKDPANNSDHNSTKPIDPNVDTSITYEKLHEAMMDQTLYSPVYQYGDDDSAKFMSAMTLHGTSWSVTKSDRTVELKVVALNDEFIQLSHYKSHDESAKEYKGGIRVYFSETAAKNNVKDNFSDSSLEEITNPNVTEEQIRNSAFNKPLYMAHKVWVESNTDGTGHEETQLMTIVVRDTSVEITENKHTRVIKAVEITDQYIRFVAYENDKPVHESYLYRSQEEANKHVINLNEEYGNTHEDDNHEGDVKEGEDHDDNNTSMIDDDTQEHESESYDDANTSVDDALTEEKVIEALVDQTLYRHRIDCDENGSRYEEDRKIVFGKNTYTTYIGNHKHSDGSFEISGTTLKVTEDGHTAKVEIGEVTSTYVKIIFEHSDGHLDVDYWYTSKEEAAKNPSDNSDQCNSKE